MNADKIDKFVQQHGGAYPVERIPDGLQVQPSGREGHFVISPSHPMTLDAYQNLLNQVQLGTFNVVP